MKALVPLITLLLLIGCNPELPGGSDLSGFDRKLWIIEPLGEMRNSVEITARQRMLKDVLTNVIPGKSKEQIVEILGHPLEKEGKFIYLMGPQRDSYFPIDNEWLYIEFDGDDKVKSAYIHNT